MFFFFIVCLVYISSRDLHELEAAFLNVFHFFEAAQYQNKELDLGPSRPGFESHLLMTLEG